MTATMRKCIAAIAIVGVTAIVAFGIWFFRATEEPPVDNGGWETFDETGNLTFNSPGASPETWYLVYEEPGAPALTAELAFTQESVCNLQSGTTTCPEGLAPGMRVRVIGKVRDNIVRTETMTEIAGTRDVELFYYNVNKDTDGKGVVACGRGGLDPVARTIPDGSEEDDIRATLALLLQGEISAEERMKGISTEYPLAGLTITNVARSGSELTITFDDPQNRTSGGACRAGILWFQIEATVKQFDGITSVRFLPEYLFQP